MWGVRGQALSHPQRLVLSGVQPGPTTHKLWVRGVRAWGSVTSPTARALASWLCTLWGRHQGARGGAPVAWVWGVRGRALSHPRPLVLSGVRLGPTTHWLRVRGARAWGPVTNPAARSCELALRAVGAARGRPGGAPLACVWGIWSRALSHPRALVLSGVRPGPRTHWLLLPGVRAWGPVTNPTARALASWLCELWGRLEGARGGRLLPGCGASGVRRFPGPDHSSFRACGRGPVPTGCLCRGCGRGDPSPTPQRALLRAGFARCGGGSRAPGGGASCLGVGRPGSGALPPPTTRPFGRAAGAHYPLAVGAGGAGVGTRHQPHSARSGELALRAVGAAGGRPGAPSCLGVERPGTGAPPPPTSRPFGRAAWACFPLAVGVVCGRPIQTQAQETLFGPKIGKKNEKIHDFRPKTRGGSFFRHF